MASAGIRKASTGRYKVWWRLDDGTQGAKTFNARSLARDFKNELLAQVANACLPSRGSTQLPRASRTSRSFLKSRAWSRVSKLWLP